MIMKNNKLAQIYSPLDHISRERFIQEYGIASCREKYAEINSCSKALETSSPLLSHIKKSYGKQSAIAYIETWLYNLNDYLNISRRLKKEQIYETALYIIQDYYYLNIAELHLFFTKLKKGEFGNLYEGIDGYKILSFLKTYEQERLSHFEKKRIKSKENSMPINEKSNFLWKNVDKIPSLRKLKKTKGKSNR